MKLDIDAIFRAIAQAEQAFDLVRELGDTVAAVLSDAGQPELQARLKALRAENDAARANRAALLAEAAKS